MGKALGLMPSWYWPDGVQRYLKAPRVALYELAVGRWAKRYGSDPALFAGGASLSFRELDAACAAVAASYLSRLADAPGRVALAVRAPEAFAPLLLGLLRTDATVLVLADSSAECAADALSEFQPDLLISDDPAVAANGARREEPADWLDGTGVRPRPVNLDPGRPSIALPGRDGLAWHSQMSLMSGAMAFAAFTKLEPPAQIFVARPPGAWEGLIGLLAPLQTGSAALLDVGGDPDAAAALVREHAPRYLWLDAVTAEGLLHESGPLVSSIRDRRPVVFVTTTASFAKRVQRSLRRLLGVPILTVYGYPETGPIAAAHPSWHVDDAVGIPMTGTDLIPLNPRSGRAVETPWDLLAYAHVGGQTNALATNVGAAGDEGSGHLDTRCYNTRTPGVIDANGMLYLLD